MYLWKFISIGCKGVRCKRFAVRVNGDNGNNSCMLNLFVIYKDMLVLCIHVCMYTYTNTHSPHELLEDLCDILKLYKKQTKTLKMYSSSSTSELHSIICSFTCHSLLIIIYIH